MYVVQCKKVCHSFTEYVQTYLSSHKVNVNVIKGKIGIRDANTPQPGEIFFNTMRYRCSETIQRSGYFQSSVSYINLQIMFK